MIRSSSSRTLSLFLLAALALVAALPARARAADPVGSALAAAAPSTDGRVLVLGFDGADARTVRALVDAEPERYPSFQRLMAEGTFAPMLVEAPPESPVAWAALNTGQNPAKTGVPGFIKRANPKDGKGAPSPTFGHMVVHDSEAWTDDPLPLAAFDHVPLPTWSPTLMAAVFGGATFLLVLFLLAVVLKLGAPVAVVIALLLGGVAGFAGMTLRGYLAESYPHTSNPNQARNFWDYAAEGGARCVVINAAQAWDMPAPDGAEVLAGLGVPDAKGKIGEWCIYTTDPEEFSRPPKGNDKNTPTAGTVFRVDELGGEISTELYGPRNFWLEDKLGQQVAEINAKLSSDIPLEKSIALSDELQRLKDELKEAKDTPVSVPMSIKKKDGEAEITIDGQTQTVAEGAWSGYYELNFELNPILEVHALTRVKLVSVNEPYFELFVNVLDIDPRKPPFWQSISSPFEFSNELALRCGLFETYGWPTATMPFKDKAIAPETLMEDVEFTMKWRERLLTDQLERNDWDCLFAVFSTTDRVQHMMYQYWDEGHPLHKGEIAEAADRTMTFFGKEIRLRDAIPAIYEQMDRIIGGVLTDHVEPDDTLMVVADHGFQTFRYQVNLNNWLVEKGYAVLKPGVRKSEGDFLGAWVDWGKTRAYSLGMGFLYLNLAGREPEGIVAPEEAEALLAELKRELLAASDPERNRPLFNEVYITKEIHSGSFLDMESDILVGFAPEYRIAWSATGGGVRLQDDQGLTVLGPTIYDNTSSWSGGHVSVALSDVAAVFASNKKVDLPADGLRSLHIAPTVLSLLGVPLPEEMDLPPLVVH